MRRRFFNAADNFVGGCYNKLSNEDIKRQSRSLLSHL
jgi:hypothetical protein